MKLMHHTPRWDATSHDEWAAWQARRLHDYLKHRIFPFSVHYRRLFQDHDFRPGDLKSLADWTRLPMTSKADLTVPKEMQREFVLIPDERTIKHEPRTIMHALFHGRESARKMVEHEFRPVLMTSTTGRSSDPVPFVYSQHDLDNLNITGRRLMECGRSSTEYRHVNTFPYAPHLAFWQSHHASIGFGTFMVSTGGGKVLGTTGNINLIDKIQPDVLIGMPTFLYHLLREAVELDKRWPNLKRVVLGGEKTAQGLRANLRDLCHELGGEVHIVSTYGFTEAKMAFPECCSSTGVTPTGFHLSPDLGIVELVDPKTGEPVAEGKPGEIVFTPLNARGTVVLRYRTGDIAEGGLVWNECPHCGRIGPRLLGPISRVSEVRSLKLDKVKGTLVDFNMLEHLLDDQKGIAAWQIELCKRNNDPMEVDEVRLHVTPENGVTPTEVENMVKHRFHQVTELTPNAIVCHSMEEMRDLLGVGRLLKEEKLVDRRNAKPAATESTKN